MDEPRPLFVKFLYFQAIYRTKTLGFSGIQTWIDGVEGEHDDHLTTTTTALKNIILFCLQLFQLSFYNFSPIWGTEVDY